MLSVYLFSKFYWLDYICFFPETFGEDIIFFLKAAVFLESATSWVFHWIFILLENFFINWFCTFPASWQAFVDFLLNICFWRLIWAHELRNLLLNGTSRALDWFLNVLHDLAFSLFSIGWITKLLTNWLLDNSWAWRCCKVFSDRFLDTALPWVMLKSIFSVLIDGFLNVFFDVLRLVHFLIFSFFHFNLSKIGRFCDVFIEELLQFVLCFSWLSFSLKRFLLSDFLV